MVDAAEELLERKEDVGGITPEGVGIVVVGLLERLFPELGMAGQGNRQEQQDGQQIFYRKLHQRFFSSRALRKASISASELKRMVMEPFPDADLRREILLVKYLPMCSRTL